MSDKFLETFSTKITPQMKYDLDKLPEELKKTLHHEVRLKIAEILHKNKFNPEDWGLEK